MKLRFTVFLLLLSSLLAPYVFADYSMPYINLNKNFYISEENIEIELENIDKVTVSSYYEIIFQKDNIDYIIERNDFINKKFIIRAPKNSGDYILKVFIAGEDLPLRKKITVKNANNDFNLYGKFIEIDTEIVGIELNWNLSEAPYIIKRYEGDNIITFNAKHNTFIDVNVDVNKTYKYIIFDKNNKSTNSIILDVKKFTTSKKMMKEKEGFMILTLNDVNMNDNNTRRYIDNDKGVLMPVKEKENGAYYIPLRAIIDTMNGTIEWKSQNDPIIIKLFTNIIEIKLDDKNIKNNSLKQSLDNPPKLIGGYTYITLEVLRTLGCYAEVKIDDDQKETILIKYSINEAEG